jgi:nicotinamide-nucleotide amidase
MVKRKFGCRAIEEWENSLPDFLKLAYLPAIGRVRLGFQEEKTKLFLENELEEYVGSLAIINEISSLV